MWVARLQVLVPCLEAWCEYRACPGAAVGASSAVTVLCPGHVLLPVWRSAFPSSLHWASLFPSLLDLPSPAAVFVPALGAPSRLDLG